MAIELITGRAGKAHIGSEDDRAYHAYTNGEGRYVLNGGTANIESANNVHVGPVEFLVDGAHVRVTGAGEDVAIENGVASYKRVDVVALHYTHTGGEDDYIESVEFAVVKGANVELGSEPQVPDMPKSGTILTGADDVYVPVYSLLIDGLTPKNLTTLLEKYALPIAQGGTGAPTASDAQRNLYPKNYGSDGYPETLYLTGFGDGFADPGHLTSAQLRAKMGLNESGAVPSANSVPWSGVSGKPSIPSALSPYPVGSVYISYDSTSPASLFGGSWTPITGVFPYFNAGTGRGGSNTHTLSVNEMPKHKHAQTIGTYNAVVGDYNDGYALPEQVSGHYANTNGPVTKWRQATQYAGSNVAHNNMPAYQTLYAWYRTA